MNAVTTDNGNTVNAVTTDNARNTVNAVTTDNARNTVNAVTEAELGTQIGCFLVLRLLPNKSQINSSNGWHFISPLYRNRSVTSKPQYVPGFGEPSHL